jgi:CPA2 family monovalent cation:H+ antiporter-2
VRRELEAAFLDYDLHLADFELAPESAYCGRMLMQLDLRRTCGVNVVRIIRGGLYVNVPGGRERLYPHDRIVVAGSDEQIRLFQQQLSEADAQVQNTIGHNHRRATVSLEQLPVLAEMPFCGKTLADSRLSEKGQCVVLGIEHEGVMTMNPDATTVINEGDTLILAGESDKIKSLLPQEE